MRKKWTIDEHRVRYEHLVFDVLCVQLCIILIFFLKA